MGTEYDNIDIIGVTHEIHDNDTDRLMNGYYHKQEVNTVKSLLSRIKNLSYDDVLDLGCSIGTWYDDYKNFGFKKVLGIDISKERADKAKARGYDEIHICNAYELPFENESRNCIISNDVLVHVLQDSDKLKIFKEVKRVLTNTGIFIFNIANAGGFGFNEDTTVKYCRMNKWETISDLIHQSGLYLEKMEPSYYAIPRVGANPKFVNMSTQYIFPLIDVLLKKVNNLKSSKVVYFTVRKTELKS